jgi:iron complex outermembrane receptor protein/outer membrane receptor for ferrienterochelin and colicins
MGYTLFAGGTQQHAFDTDKDGFSDVPEIKSVFVHPRIFFYGKDKSSLVLGYTLSYEDRNGGNMKLLRKQTGGAGQFFIQNKSLRNTADVIWEKPLNDNAQFTAKASTSFFSRDVNTNVFGMKGRQQTWYTEAAYSQKSDHHNWVAGINFNGDNFSKRLPDSSLVPNESNTTFGMFIQDDWKFAQGFTLQGGLRMDATNRYGAFVLPRLSLMYKASSHVTMRLGGGLGYKTPTLFNSEVDERDYHYLMGYVGGIKAERSLGANFDINYKNKLGEWQLTLNQTFFYNRITKPLQLDTAGTAAAPVYFYQNENQALRTMGTETYVQATHDELELYLGYVYTNAKRRYDAANPNLPLIARHKIATVIAYEFSPAFRAGVESAYTGKQWLDNGTTTTPYVFTAVMVRYNVGKAAFVLNCENLFDYRQNKKGPIVIPPYNNPHFPEIWAPIDGRVINLSMYLKW